MTQATLIAPKTVISCGPETVPQFSPLESIAKWIAWNKGELTEDPDTDTSYVRAEGSPIEINALLGIGSGFLSFMVPIAGDDDDADDWWDNNDPICLDRSTLQGIYDRSPSLGECTCNPNYGVQCPNH